MGDDGIVADELDEPRKHVADGRRRGNVRVRDAREVHDVRGDLTAWVDERTEVLSHLAVDHADGPDLDDPVDLRINARRLEVNRDEAPRRALPDALTPHHSSPFLTSVIFFMAQNSPHIVQRLPSAGCDDAR